jgi:hypothetical protein
MALEADGVLYIFGCVLSAELLGADETWWRVMWSGKSRASGRAHQHRNGKASERAGQR